MGKPAEIKTKANTASVEEFIATIPDEQKRKDSLVLVKMMQKASKEKPKMWGAAIIGFGDSDTKVKRQAEKWIGLKLVFLRVRQTCRYIFL